MITDYVITDRANNLPYFYGLTSGFCKSRQSAASSSDFACLDIIMPRAERLLDLLQVLRQHRFPITGQALAEQMGISLRTLYRDIHTLQHMGANIEGEAGIGYLLRSGFTLPPLMFSEEELEAICLGTRWVMRDENDQPLASAARSALAKINNVIPAHLKTMLDQPALLVAANGNQPLLHSIDLASLRYAIRAERKTEIIYLDAQGSPSTRIIWPFALGYFEQLRVIAAWCELRQALRHFRTDRIQHLKVLEQRFPIRRHTLLKQWREQENIPSHPANF